MATERLSKLQKWILNRCYEITFLPRDEVRMFFGKEFGPRKEDKEVGYWSVNRIDKKFLDKKTRQDRKYNYDTRQWTDEYKTVEYYTLKPEFLATKSEEVTISRTLTNLKDKGYIKQLGLYGEYYLTDKGLAIVNKCRDGETNVNVKPPELKFHPINIKEYQSKVDQKLKEISDRDKERELRNKPISPAKQAKIRDLQYELMKFQGKFKIDEIIKQCCPACDKKIKAFADECGKQKLEELKKEIEGMD